jgi:hypothetical protein
VPGAISGWSEPRGTVTGLNPVLVSPPDLEPLEEGPYAGRPQWYPFYRGSAVSGQCVDAVQFEIDWGDGTGSGWLPPGQRFARHAYGSLGTFAVRGRTRAYYAPGEVSEWSAPSPVQVRVFTAPDWTAKWASLKRSCKGKGTTMRCTLKGKLVVENRGTESAPAAPIELQLRSVEATTTIGSLTSPSLVRNAATTIKVTVSLPVGEKGTGASVVAVVDPGNAVDELNEANNEAVYGPLR